MGADTERSKGSWDQVFIAFRMSDKPAGASLATRKFGRIAAWGQPNVQITLYYHLPFGPQRAEPLPKWGASRGLRQWQALCEHGVPHSPEMCCACADGMKLGMAGLALPATGLAMVMNKCFQLLLARFMPRSSCACERDGLGPRAEVGCSLWGCCRLRDHRCTGQSMA